MFSSMLSLLGSLRRGNFVQNSLRFRSSASAYLSRTPSVAGNRKTWTWSGWVKRGTLGTIQVLFGQGTGVGANGYGFLRFDSNDKLEISASSNGAASSITWATTAVFRDPSAWYHIVATLDTTQATAANRFLLYVNGVLQAGSFVTTPTQNADIEINRNAAHQIGAANATGLANYLDGYITDVNFIDSQALTPSSFGQIESTTGVWSPKQYVGSYGTNGFYLKFADASAATAAAIGKDSSGNGNNWTPSGISVTAGVTYDSMIDVPVNYSDSGNGRGNYCTLNPLIRQAAASSSITAGNLEQNTTLTGSEVYALSTISLPSTGKYYAEISIVAASGVNTSGTQIGLVSGARTSGDNNGRLDQCPSSTVYRADGQKGIDAVFTAYGAAWGNGDVIGVAVDMDAASVTFYKNNASQGAITSLDSQDVFIGVCLRATAGTGFGYANFGQRPFTYTPPAGFRALNTNNLPTPSIVNGANFMAATTYTGNAAARSLSNAVNNVSFQPDLVWIKSRTPGATSHALFDSSRGVTKYLSSNTTTAETTLAQSLTALNADGFSLGTDTTLVNASANLYVAWQWKAGGAAVSNTQGTITSQVSANTTAGFSVVTYTGTGANATVGHGLGVAPRFIMVKNRTGNNTRNWCAYHAGIINSQNGGIYPNLPNAWNADATIFNNTAPTSTVFSVGAYLAVNTETLVAYCFAEIAGFSKFGSYTGNGSADGPFVFCGFRPRFVMVKRTDVANDWRMFDVSRSTSNVSINTLFANSAVVEETTFNFTDILSNGFKPRSADNATNATGGTYIFMAFAEVPSKYALAR